MLKRYTSHKEVEAAEIISIGSYFMNEQKETVRPITIEGGEVIICPHEMFVRYIPSPGDFYVVYRDGYQSFSPRKEFLDGYTLQGQSFTDIKAGINKRDLPTSNQ